MCRAAATQSNSSPGRQLGEFVVWLMIAVLLFRAWGVEGFIVPSGSMADTLHGVHRELMCVSCGHRYSVGTDLSAIPAHTDCPNCGHEDNRLKMQPDVSGDRLLVHKSAFDVRSPERWEVVVFRSPDLPRKVYVKRVVGLPGERVEIRQGDVYIDGHIARKSPDRQRALAVLVHEDRPEVDRTDLVPARWVAERPNDGWKRSASGFAYAVPQQSDAESERIHWLSYRHLRHVPGYRSEFHETPITDDLGYNQGVSRLLNQVGDLMLQCEIQTAADEGELHLRLHDGREELTAILDLQRRQVALYVNEDEVARTALPVGLLNVAQPVVFSCFDRQLSLAVGGNWLIDSVTYAASERAYQPTSRPVSLGVRGHVPVAIGRLRVLRDVYYTLPDSTAHAWACLEPCQLGSDELFVLGDNSPISEDSRMWESGPGVSRSLLVGKPLVVHLPSRVLELGGTRFQVPDPRGIRYIR